MMSNEFLFRLLVSAAAVLITDVILFLGLRRLFVKQGLPSRGGKRFTWIYLAITLIFILYACLHYIYLHFYESGSTAYRQYLFITGAFLLIYGPKALMAVFILAGNLFLFLIQLISFAFQGRGHYEFVRKTWKLKFLSWVGFMLGCLFFGYILYGMLYTRTDYRVKEVSVSYRDLPKSFDGVKVMVIADLHMGSFFNQKEIIPAIREMRDRKPDMILFAGDMINVTAEETEPYLTMFSELKPPLGKFSAMGNHDQDDYMKLTPTEGKTVIEQKLVKAEQKMGFTVLRNDHIFVHKGNDSIAILGVDSWGIAPFHQFGNLEQAMKGVPRNVFKILISHIPEHWPAEVRAKTNIDLMLAGHTHAAQFGIDEPWMHWSPIGWKHPFYMGLYQWGSQYLYVNAGLGYLGFPGRVGIPPEITVITLKCE